ncbi:MAG: NADH-quinone oxidoreductase subunit J [Chloroflexi bacterium]|nr:NADH-quinone oxidoreductase subunit J [Chloroflexota bacterium]
MGLMTVFILTGAVAIAAALGLLFARNAVYAVLFLVLNMFALAVLYLLLGAPFIAMVQIVVYAGAIMVLFLFVVMLLGAEELKEDGGPIGWQRPLALVLGVVLLAELAYFVFAASATKARLLPSPDGFGDPHAVGLTLFQKYLLPFEVTSVLLLVAMVGAIVLVRNGKRTADEPTGSDAD